MGQIGIWQILIIAVVILLLFGRGRIADVMGDFGKGVSSFKKGLNEEEKPADPSAKLEAPQSDAAPTSETKSTDKQA